MPMLPPMATPSLIGTPMCHPDPDHEKRRSDAEAVLYRTVQAVDPETGETTLRRVETPLYRDYLANQAAYHKARAAYADALQEAPRRPRPGGAPGR